MLTIGDFARLAQVSPRMLRHYDEIGLLRPDRVEPATGYRLYAVGQLARLHRLVALRDLGLSLQQIGNLLDQEVSIDQLRGMLRMRQAQVEQTLVDEQARLRRIEAHLRALEGSTNVVALDIVIKSTDPLRVAEAVGTAAGFGPDLGDIFERLYPQVAGHLQRAGVRPGMGVAWYEEPADDGSVVVHAGFAIGDQTSTGGDGVRVVDCPSFRWHRSFIAAQWTTLVRCTSPSSVGSRTVAIACPVGAGSCTSNGTTRIRIRTSPSFKCPVTR